MSWIYIRAICSLDFALPSKIYPEIDVKQIKLCFPLLFHKRSHHTDYHSNIHLSTVIYLQEGDCEALPTGDCEALPTGDCEALPAGDREALPAGDWEALPLGDCI
jgi:hypothetical protein